MPARLPTPVPHVLCHRRYERGLVEDVTAPGGVRAVPDKEKLAAFLQVCVWGY
jgi:hypothetical protein